MSCSIVGECSYTSVKMTYNQYTFIMNNVINANLITTLLLHLMRRFRPLFLSGDLDKSTLHAFSGVADGNSPSGKSHSPQIIMYTLKSFSHDASLSYPYN